MVDKLFEYYDSIFFGEKVEVDSFGKMGTHYNGLEFDYYISSSILDTDYLSIEDYFERVAKVGYNETESLFYQYSGLEVDKKLKVISAILSLVNQSSYKEAEKDRIIAKSKAFLHRFGLEVVEDNNNLFIKNEMKLFEGSYCDILFYNDLYYRKQLKSKYRKKSDWRKRFKYEFENMEKLADNPYVLKVFSYDEEDDSYLMEKCDVALFEYLEANQFISDDEIIEIICQIVEGMSMVHKAGILHRDLHLGNILLKNNRIILMDFGLSKDTMIEHSLMSTSTPKNSHYFMDPIGLSNFIKLDKLSDIYSVGKIIDYITRNSEINTKLSFVINKSTDRIREQRYADLEDLLSDLKSTLKDVSQEEKIEKIEKNIRQGKNSPEVEGFILNLVSQDRLAGYIVENRLNDFAKLIVSFSESNQEKILNSISNTYVEATGYGGFANYDLFAGIMFSYINTSKIARLKRIAYGILDGCASYRYNSKNYLDRIDITFPSLKQTVI